jgi:hypothetical protein
MRTQKRTCWEGTGSHHDPRSLATKMHLTQPPALNGVPEASLTVLSQAHSKPDFTSPKSQTAPAPFD